MSRGRTRELALHQAALPILFLLGLIVYGLILRPHALDQAPFPLEIVFLLAGCFAIGQQLLLGHRWEDVQGAIVSKLGRAMPAFFILFSIGLIISSWILSGTIPMLVYFGLKVIDPTFLYVLAFLVPIVFSTLTGTSWGSAGTIGVVIVGIAAAMDANLGITAGAVIGGAYFGDKMSPLSDTTNMAALATDVELFDHVHSMAFTTLPSAVLAGVAFLVLGFVEPPASGAANTASVTEFLDALQRVFSFDVLLLLPPVIVLVGSLKRLPTVPVLMVSMGSACLLALVFQRFGVSDVMQALNGGFEVGMAPWAGEVPPRVAELLERGGLYALIDAIVIAFTVFVFVGALDHVDAMPRVVGRVFRFARGRRSTILSSLFAAAFTNSLTSNQYATSFIVGDAFKSKYDRLGIPRKVLSRSLEDTGTMIESLVPWHPTAVFMVATLGVPFADYWHWQLLSLINLVLAPAFAILGVACFVEKGREVGGT